MLKFETIRETKKALQLSTEGNTFWIQKRWMRDDGTLTPKGEEAMKAATTNTQKSGKWYFVCKYRELREISDKAELVKCYDGSEAILPKSQIKYGLDKIFIPGWLVKQKNIQVGQRRWFDD